jgi:hypothetical protein
MEANCIVVRGEKEGGSGSDLSPANERPPRNYRRLSRKDVTQADNADQKPKLADEKSRVAGKEECRADCQNGELKKETNNKLEDGQGRFEAQRFTRKEKLPPFEIDRLKGHSQRAEQTESSKETAEVSANLVKLEEEIER